MEKTLLVIRVLKNFRFLSSVLAVVWIVMSYWAWLDADAQQFARLGAFAGAIAVLGFGLSIVGLQVAQSELQQLEVSMGGVIAMKISMLATKIDLKYETLCDKGYSQAEVEDRLHQSRLDVEVYKNRILEDIEEHQAQTSKRALGRLSNVQIGYQIALAFTGTVQAGFGDLLINRMVICGGWTCST